MNSTLITAITTITTLLLFGCATKQPVMTDLQLPVDTPQPLVYLAGETAKIQGRDLRPGPEVVVFTVNDQPASALVNKTAPHTLITDKLATGLAAQGLAFSADSRVHLQLDLKELLVRVERSSLRYKGAANTKITLVINHSGSTLTKNYNREATREWLSRPKVVELERMVADQVGDIISQILQDEEIKRMIRVQ